MANIDPWVAFWAFCALLVVFNKVPKIIQAMREYRCEHDWEKIAHGPLVENMGTPDERRVGSYMLYRCEVCGGSRDYR